MLRYVQYILLFCFVVVFTSGCSDEATESPASTNGSPSESSEQEQTFSADSEPPQTDKPTFRGIPFGAQKAKIRKWEDGNLMGGDDKRLIYRGYVAGLDVGWSYDFTPQQKQFARALYIFQE